MIKGDGFFIGGCGSSHRLCSGLLATIKDFVFFLAISVLADHLGKADGISGAFFLALVL